MSKIRNLVTHGSHAKYKMKEKNNNLVSSHRQTSVSDDPFDVCRHYFVAKKFGLSIVAFTSSN